MAEHTLSERLPIQQSALEGASVRTVDARDLYAFLEVKKDFSDWIKAQIQRARLLEGRDYIAVPQKGDEVIKDLAGLRPGLDYSVEYFLTIEASKHVAMMSGTDKGFEAREYFLDCERRAQTPVITANDLAMTLARFMDSVGVSLDAHGHVIRRVETRVDALDQKVDSGFSQINGRFDDIETRLVRRANFSAYARRLFTLVVHRFYAGRCPCCQETPILGRHGEPLPDVLRFDHWNGKQHNLSSNGWAVCVACNRDLERNRHARHLAFQLFHQHLNRVQAGGEQMVLALTQNAA